MGLLMGFKGSIQTLHTLNIFRVRSVASSPTSMELGRDMLGTTVMIQEKGAGHKIGKMRLAYFQ